MWNCPKCNEASEDNCDSCWKCGTSRNSKPAAEPMAAQSPSPRPSKTNWPLASGIMLAPAALSLVAAFAGAANGAAFFTFFGSAVAAILVGYLEAGRFADSQSARVILSLLVAIPAYVVCLMLCFCGCAAGNSVR